ncbi:MAG: ABC transporter substrate-binding protein [Anaerolineae bacterium]
MERRGTVALLIVALLSLILVACSVEPATPTPVPLEPVSLQLQWVTQAQFAGYYVALDKGWYREEGIDLTIQPGAPDFIPVDLVTAGIHEFGTSLLADLAIAIQDGKPVVSVAQIQQENGLLLIARKASGIERPTDFTGKRVGVWLGSWEAQFNALVAKEQVAPDAFELVAQGFSMDPFIAGELDVASAMIYNEYDVVLNSGIGIDELNIIDYADYGLDMPGDTLFTTTMLAEENPDLVVRMLRASLRGWQYAVDHPDEAVGIVLKYDESGLQTRPHQTWMMNQIARLVQGENRRLGFTREADVRRTIDTLLRYQILTEPLDPGRVYTNEFWAQANAQ